MTNYENINILPSILTKTSSFSAVAKTLLWYQSNLNSISTMSTFKKKVIKKYCYAKDQIRPMKRVLYLQGHVRT